jgi:hypothetical protein
LKLYGHTNIGTQIFEASCVRVLLIGDEEVRIEAMALEQGVRCPLLGDARRLALPRKPVIRTVSTSLTPGWVRNVVQVLLEFTSS